MALLKLKILKLITECTANNDNLLIIEDITLTPDPPEKGKTLKIDFKGYLEEEVVKGAYVDIKVKLGLVQLIHKKFDFCKEIENINEKCPIPEGDLQISKEVKLPGQIPRGNYDVVAIIVNNDGKQVTCLHGKTHFN
ncbi:unnamed protein product [Cunninghamella blakesleeana]